MFYKQHTNCRVCGSENLSQYLDLGELPLTNNLCTTWEEKADRYPLKLMVCQKCWLSQLSIVVNPQILFGNYVYRSSISNDFMKHCLKMAYDLQVEYELDEKTFHIDIAGNDGALLTQFQYVLNHKVLNVDPARNLAPICEAKNIKTIPKFWSEKVAFDIVNENGRADLITATNVIAHIDNLEEFFIAIKIVLKDTGILVIECPYLLPFIVNNEFPTLYQEHLSVMSVYPMSLMCKRMGLTLMKVEYEDIHCGSIRMHIGHGNEDKSVGEFIAQEAFTRNMNVYEQFERTSKEVIQQFKEGIMYHSVKTIAAFAASAKGNTLLNAAGIDDRHIQYIVDQTPEKIGMYSPGTHIKIVSELHISHYPPDYLLILSWNFSHEIITKCRSLGYKGKFIIPIPSFKIID